LTAWRSQLLVAFALVLLGARAYAAAGSVSLLGVSGHGGADFADALEADIGELYQLVPGEAYRRTAQRLGKLGPTPDDVRAVCTNLRLDALVAGSVSGEGRQRRLTIVVREGISGEVVSRRRYDLSSRTLPLLREQVLRDMVRALERVRHIPKKGAIAAVPPPAPPPSEEPTNEAAEEAPSEAPSEEVEPAAEPSLEAVHEPRSAERTRRGFFAAVGPAIMSRSLGFDVASAPGYAGGVAPAISIEGGVFPLALSSELAGEHPVLASFGLLASYERAFDLTSQAAVGGSSAGHASRWTALLAGRVPLGHESRGGTLTIETGFQRMSWGSASPAQIGVPDVTYDLVTLGAAWERALGTRWVELGVHVAAQVLVDGGMIMTNAQYGAGSGWGLDLDAALTVRPTRWLWLRVTGRYTPIFLSFRAEGSRLAHSASDRFADGALEVGFAL
jgi:hypothetical protein